MQESQPDLARAGAHRGAPGENQRAAHAFGAAEDPQRAEGSLVDVARAAREHGGQRSGQRRPVEPMPARIAVRSQCRACAPTRRRTGPVRRSVSRPGLRAMNVAVAKARMAGACACPVAASTPLGMSSARIGAPLAFAHSTSSAIAAFRRPREADPEQAVDHERPAGSDGGAGERRAAGLGEALVGGRGILRQSLRVAREDDVHVVIAAAQQARGDECVAAVVAGTGEDDDRRARGRRRSATRPPPPRRPRAP